LCTDQQKYLKDDGFIYSDLKSLIRKNLINAGILPPGSLPLLLQRRLDAANVTLSCKYINDAMMAYGPASTKQKDSLSQAVPVSA
jgi:hypothetical protein